MDIRFLGHAAFALEHDGDTTVLIDPFLTGNPKAAVERRRGRTPTTILLTHGHADHIGDTVAIAKRTGATVVAIVELARRARRGPRRRRRLRDPNIGGTVEFDWGWVRARARLAHLDDAEGHGQHRRPASSIDFGGKTIYHLGDTALFTDLALPGRRDARSTSR